MSPGEVDPRIVRRHLLALRKAATNLQRHAGRPIDRLSGDNDERWAVERGLQVAAQNVLDIATHIAAGRGRDVPDYASAIVALGQLGILPSEFIADIQGLAGFRNILVHGYLDVDVERLHAVLNERLGDLETFARLVEEFLESTES